MPLSKSSSVPGIIWWIIPRHLSSSTKFIRYVWKCFFINLFVTAKVRLFRCQDKKRRSFPAAVVCGTPRSGTGKSLVFDSQLGENEENTDEKNAPFAYRGAHGGKGAPKEERLHRQRLLFLCFHGRGRLQHLCFVAELGKALLEIGHIRHIGIESHRHRVIFHIGLHVLHPFLVGDVAFHLGLAVHAGHLFHLEDHFLQLLGCGAEHRAEEDEKKEYFFHIG